VAPSEKQTDILRFDADPEPWRALRGELEELDYASIVGQTFLQKLDSVMAAML